MAANVVLWPDGVPDCLSPLSPQGGLRDNRYSFETDEPHPPIERPMSSWTPEVYSVELSPLSRDQFVVFQNWYRNALAYGVHPFAMRHPITLALSAWKFVKASPPYQVRKIGLLPDGSTKRRIVLSFSIMSFPADVPAVYLHQEEGDLVLQEQEDRIVLRDGVPFDG